LIQIQRRGRDEKKKGGEGLRGGTGINQSRIREKGKGGSAGAWWVNLLRVGTR